MKVVVDASNVAHHVKNENGQPQMSNILAAVKALEESEDESVIIADASLRHDIDDKEKFLNLLENENVEEVPACNDADHFILEIAYNEMGLDIGPKTREIFENYVQDGDRSDSVINGIMNRNKYSEGKSEFEILAKQIKSNYQPLLLYKQPHID